MPFRRFGSLTSIVVPNPWTRTGCHWEEPKWSQFPCEDLVVKKWKTNRCDESKVKDWYIFASVMFVF